MLSKHSAKMLGILLGLVVGSIVAAGLLLYALGARL